MDKEKTQAITSYWRNKKTEKSRLNDLIKQVLEDNKTIDELLELGELDEEHIRIFDKKVNSNIKPHTFAKLFNWITKRYENR